MQIIAEKSLGSLHFRRVGQVTANIHFFGLSRISNALHKTKAKLMYFLILSQFNYYSVTWIFHTKKSYRKMEHTQNRGLRIVYNEPLHVSETTTKL